MSDDDIPDFLRDDDIPTSTAKTADPKTTTPAAATTSAGTYSAQQQTPAVTSNKPSNTTTSSLSTAGNHQKAPLTGNTASVTLNNTDTKEEEAEVIDDDVPDFLSEPPPPPPPKGGTVPPPAYTYVPSPARAEARARAAAALEAQQNGGGGSWLSPSPLRDRTGEKTFQTDPLEGRERFRAEEEQPKEPSTTAATTIFGSSPSQPAVQLPTMASRPSTSADMGKQLQAAPGATTTNSTPAAEDPSLEQQKRTSTTSSDRAAAMRKLEEDAAEEAERQQRKGDTAANDKSRVDNNASAILAHAMGIRARHLEALTKAGSTSVSGSAGSPHQLACGAVSRTPEPTASPSSTAKAGRRANTSMGNYNGDDDDEEDECEAADDDDIIARRKAKEQKARKAPKYSYLSPEHLLKHEQETHAARLQAKRDRHRNEQIRLRNLAIARERENDEKSRKYLESQEFYSTAVLNSTRDGRPNIIHDVNVTTTQDSQLNGKRWFPTSRHGGRDSKHKPPLGYGSMSSQAWLSGFNSSSGSNTNNRSVGGGNLNSTTSGGGHGAGASSTFSPYSMSRASSPSHSPMRSDYGSTDRFHLDTVAVRSNSSAYGSTTTGNNNRRNTSTTGGGGPTRGGGGKRSDISPLRPFDEQTFEDITKAKEQERIDKLNEEKWSHIRMIQKKRAESVKIIEARKRDRQRQIEEQLKSDVVAAQAEKDAKREMDQQFAFEMRNLDRERRQKIAAYKEERAKAVLKNALELRMQALQRAEDQEHYDREVKQEVRTAGDMQRQAYLQSLQEEREKHEARMAKEAALRMEIEARQLEYNAQQEEQKRLNREAKLERVDRQIKDKTRHREKEHAELKERQYETDHMYSTLLKAKRPWVIESRAGGANDSKHRASTRGNSSSGGSYDDAGGGDEYDTTAPSQQRLTHNNRNKRSGSASNGVLKNEQSRGIDADIVKADREQKKLSAYYHVKA